MTATPAPAERPHAPGRLGRILLVTVLVVTVGSIVLLVALALLVAESDPTHKSLIIRLAPRRGACLARRSNVAAKAVAVLKPSPSLAPVDASPRAGPAGPEARGRVRGSAPRT